MQPRTIRPFRSMADARPQYELWLAATESLTRPWRSSLRNVEHQLAHGVAYPGCRLYAERADGSFAGYIGTHPPFKWEIEEHGPPDELLGWAIPFGFPWTHPRDAQLEEELYGLMCESVPVIYAASKRDIYIQRFRESWVWVTEWLTERGWKAHDRLPLIGREIAEPGQAPPDLAPVTREDLGLIAALSRSDPTAATLPLTSLEGRYDGGWIAPESFWRLGERGAFALEARGPWCEVTALYAPEASWDETLRAAAAKAHEAGAREIYFTVAAKDTALRAALESQGFSEVDAGVYYVCDAD